MINRRYNQRGMTFLGMAFSLSLGIFFLLLLFKVGPIYTEHATIKSALQTMKQQSDLASQSREMILASLQTRLNVNNVRILVPENISVTKRGSYVKVQITYDHTAHLLGNLDVVAHFDDFFEIGSE